MFRRSALQDLRFSPVLSAIGGGEDIDLGARVSMLHGMQFVVLKPRVLRIRGGTMRNRIFDRKKKKLYALWRRNGNVAAGIQGF